MRTPKCSRRYTRFQFKQTGEMLLMPETQLIGNFLKGFPRAENSGFGFFNQPGVIAIKRQIRILEIYADEAAYRAHLQTPHFLEYKTTTLKMVKSLKLVDMNAISPETMTVIFRKLVE